MAKLTLLQDTARLNAERDRLLLNALDNLNDLPISPEWAAEWCNAVENLLKEQAVLNDERCACGVNPRCKCE